MKQEPTEFELAAAGSACPGVGAAGPAIVSELTGSEPTRSTQRPLTAVSSRIGTVLVSHTTVDVYSAFVPPIIGLLEVRCQLTSWETASLLGVGSVSSGLAQPIAAWLSDRFDTRIFGALGLTLAAICLCFIGAATNYAELLALFIIGMVGVGMYHPVGASSVGQLADRGIKSRRALMLSVFFVAGMIGGTAGSMISPAITARDGGFESLRWLIFPGLVMAVVLFFAIRRVPHRHEHHRTCPFDPAEQRYRWMMIAVLYVSSAMRFTVNIALLYLFVRYAQDLIVAAAPEMAAAAQSDIARAAAPINGRLNAATTVGMAVGGLMAGTLLPAGREKWPMVLVPILFAPTIIVLPLLGQLGGIVMAALAGVGFASMIPVSLGLAQRLLPHRTSLASGLMLGGAWSLAVTGPLLCEWCLSTINLTISQTFIVIAALLVLSGLVCLLLDRQLLVSSAKTR